jgi:hypothetical protein
MPSVLFHRQCNCFRCFAVATIRDVAESLTGVWTPVPSAAPGVCRICHGCPNPGFETCWSCASVTSQVNRPCDLVVPISLYEIPSQLHHILRHYKSGSYPRHEADFGARVISLLAYFLMKHEECITNAAGGGWDVVTSVPSSRPRSGEHPLVTNVHRVRWLDDQFETLLKLGTVEVGHLKASDYGFEPVRDVRGERVLLVDDTFTTGATAQSATSALTIAGATVTGIVAIGRVIKPEFSPTVKEYWDRQWGPRAFTFDKCCLE